MNEYPEGFPCPLISGYSYGVDMGLLRNPTDIGIVEQRRRYKTMRHLFNLGLVVRIGDLDSVVSWLNSNGYEFFQMPLVSYLSDTEVPSPHIVRVVSDLRMTPVQGTREYMTLEFQVETAT